MKKYLTGLVIMLTLNIASYAQNIKINVTISEHNKLINDTLTTAYIMDLSDSIKIKANCDNLEVLLQPDKEYIFVFVRQGYNSKKIYVSTDKCIGNFRINMDIDLVKGSSDIMLKAGYLWYDDYAKTFRYVNKQAQVIKRYKEYLAKQ